MPKRSTDGDMHVKAITLVVIAAGSLGCKERRRQPEPSREARRLDSAQVELISFDDVSEKVWDVGGKASAFPAPEKRRAFREGIRKGVRSCLCPELPGLINGLPNDFYLSLSIFVDEDGDYTAKLGGFRNHSEPAGSVVMRALARVEGCVERSLRSDGFDRDSVGGRRFSVNFPFHHGVPCTNPMDDYE
jgi:hypothetical protein